MSGYYIEVPVGIIAIPWCGASTVEYKTEYWRQWIGPEPRFICDECLDAGIDFRGPERARFCTCEIGQQLREDYAEQGLTEDDMAAEYAIVFEHRAKRLADEGTGGHDD